MKRCVVCGNETDFRFELYTICRSCYEGGAFDAHLRISNKVQRKELVCLDCGAQFPEHTEVCGGSAYPAELMADYATVKKAKGYVQSW